MLAVEEGPGAKQARIRWGIAEVSAAVAVLATLLAGLAGIIRIAIAQDRTERTATEAKATAEKAAVEVGGVKDRLTRIEEKIERIPRMEEKIDRILDRGRP